MAVVVAPTLRQSLLAIDGVVESPSIFSNHTARW